MSSSTTFKLLDQQFGETRAPLILVIVRDAYKISQASRRPLGWLKTKNLDALAVSQGEEGMTETEGQIQRIRAAPGRPSALDRGRKRQRQS